METASDSNDESFEANSWISVKVSKLATKFSWWQRLNAVRNVIFLHVTVGCLYKFPLFFINSKLWPFYTFLRVKCKISAKKKLHWASLLKKSSWKHSGNCPIRMHWISLQLVIVLILATTHRGKNISVINQLNIFLVWNSLSDAESFVSDNKVSYIRWSLKITI